MAPLKAFDPQLGPNPRYCYPEPETLHMKEKAFSVTGDDFAVKTVSGKEICVCKGKMLSISDKKDFTDTDGNLLFHLKNKHFTLFKSFHGEDAHGHEIFVVSGKISVGTSKSTCTFKNASDGREIELQIKGSWFDRSASITFGGEPVAHISREFFNVRQIFADKQTYFVQVAPGVDLTLIAALCVCLDEKENEK